MSTSGEGGEGMVAHGSCDEGALSRVLVSNILHRHVRHEERSSISLRAW